MDMEMTATGTLVSQATEADDQAWSFFDVELSEYDANSSVGANVKVLLKYDDAIRLLIA